MIPLILGLGGLAAKVAAAAVIPRIFRAISRCIPTTTPTRPPEPVSVERISSGSETPQTTAKWGVSLPQPRSRKWGYAGLFHHGPSGLDLATFRAYDSKMGRWISRDPLGESAGLNLYAYCGNNPINCVDPDGLLKRNRDGTLVFKPILEKGKPVVYTLPHDSGAQSDTNPGYLYADDGTPIPAYRNIPKGKSKIHDPRMKSSCHGTTFADDQYWINNEDAQKIIDGDGYKWAGPPFLQKPRDVVIYRDPNTREIVHSGTIKTTGGDIRVWGHGGVNPNAEGAIGPGPGTFWDRPATVEFYRR